MFTACADRVKIDDGQRMNTVFQAKDWFTSFFVRAVPDGVILIDAGFRKGASRRALEDLGHTTDEVRHVFLTHGRDAAEGPTAAQGVSMTTNMSKSMQSKFG